MNIEYPGDPVVSKPIKALGAFNCDFAKKQRVCRPAIYRHHHLDERARIVGIFRTCKLDGVLIARGAIGNPWIFQSLNDIWKGKSAPSPPDLAEQAEVIQKHFGMLCALFGEKKAIGYFRKFLVRYCRLHPARQQVQKELIAANTKIQLLAAIEKWYRNHDYE